MQLPELKGAVTSDKTVDVDCMSSRGLNLYMNSTYLPSICTPPSYPWKLTFLDQVASAVRETKSSAIVSVERTRSTVKKCCTGFPLTNHLPFMWL